MSNQVKPNPAQQAAEQWLTATARKAGPHGVTADQESMMRLGYEAGYAARELTAAQGVGRPDDDWHLRGYTYASKQATKCAQCGEYKHTPLRVDEMDGYVCLTCIDKKLEEFFDASQPTEPQGAVVDAEMVERACKSFLNDWPSFHQHEREQFRKDMRAALEAALPVAVGAGEPNHLPVHAALVRDMEIVGTRCLDGGACHHSCRSACFRKNGCVPLTIAESYLNDDWTLKTPATPAGEATNANQNGDTK